MDFLHLTVFLIAIVGVCVDFGRADCEACCKSRSFSDYGFSRQLARVPGVTATMSSQYTSPTGTYTPDKGIDGIYIPNHYPDSLFTTQSEQSPWYQIDLGKNRCVRGVTIWNRGTWAPFENRFKNALISVAESTSAPGFGTTNSATKCHYRAGTQGFIRHYQCSEPMYGRYVRITGVNQNDYLNFYEVEVHGWY